MSKGAASSSDAPCSSDAKAPKRRAPTSASPATEESATKRSKSAGKKTAAVEQAAENGVILKIVVENFMNHGHMQIDLDPHVNFIVGKNGSGKSAIVAACIAGLGCKAATTGRNLSSYKHFIKHGTDYALVQIHLANGGHDPYCHDEFGDVIVVEHRIEKSGGGTYRLKSADGRVDRKVTKKVVEELNLHYNIQADNPCSLLTQEAAKKFLHNGNEEDRYRFFLGAANLGTQKQDLMSAQVNLVNMQEKTEKAQQRIPEFEEYARAAKAEYDGAKQLKELERMKEQMEPMVAWAQVAAKEREHAQLELDAATADQGVGQAQAKCDALEAELASLEEQKKAAEGVLGELFQEMERLTKETQQAAAAAKEPQKKMKEAARNAESAKEDHANAQQALEMAKDTLTHLENTLQDRQQALAAERAAKQRSFKEQIARSEKEHHAAKAKVDQLKAEGERQEAARGQYAESLAGAKQDLQRAAQELKEMSSKSVNVLKNLHPSMPALVAAVKSCKRFRGPVVGPLGEYVKINQGFGHLALAAECALRGQTGLSAFVVTCKEDEKELRQLADSVRLPPPPVTIRPAEKRFTVAANTRMKTDHTTLLDAITISDDLMFNYFLDAFGSGQTLLFATGEEARQAVWVQARPPNAPNKLTGVMNDNQSFVYASFERGTQVRDQVGYKSRGLLIADQAARKGYLEQQLQLRKSELAAVEQQARQADATLKQLRDDEKKQRKELARHSDLYRQASNGLKELEQTDADEALADLESARDDVEQEQEKAERAAADEETYRQEQARWQAEYAPRKAKFDEAKERVLKVQADAEAQRKETDAFDTPIRRKLLERRRLEKELAAAQEGGAKKRKEAAEVAAYIAKFAPLVEQSIGPRVDDPEQRSVEQLKADYDKAKKKLERAEQKHGGKSLTELEATMVSTMRVLQVKKDELLICDRTYAEVKASFATRYKHWCREVKTKGKQAALDFNLRLSRKQHAGTLNFNHDEETLKLDVARNSQDTQAKSTSDARNLSGGERSFTTLCFELAMWEFCETPFRVLDEFDVYMDDTYRKIAVDTLLEICESQPSRQFIFITPQDMHPFLKRRAPMPRVVKMNDVRPAGA